VNPALWADVSRDLDAATRQAKSAAQHSTASSIPQLNYAYLLDYMHYRHNSNRRLIVQLISRLRQGIRYPV
jgi:hypothetical protein